MNILFNITIYIHALLCVCDAFDIAGLCNCHKFPVANLKFIMGTAIHFFTPKLTVQYTVFSILFMFVV